MVHKQHGHTNGMTKQRENVMDKVKNLIPLSIKEDKVFGEILDEYENAAMETLLSIIK